MSNFIVFIFSLFIAFVALWGVLGQSGIRDKKPRPVHLCYYTTLSNLLIAFYHLLLCLALALRLEGLLAFLRRPVICLSVMLCILLTFLVYHFLLRPAQTKQGAYPKNTAQILDNYCVHYFAPLLTLAGWLLFAPKDGLTFADAALWLLCPLAYLAFALVRAPIGPPFYEGGPRYPYAFMDFDKLGPRRALANCALMFVGGYALGCLFVLLAKAITSA